MIPINFLRGKLAFLLNLRYLMVSDMFVCLFEADNWDKSRLKLIFWTNLKSLITIRKNLVGNLVKFFWRQKTKSSHYIMELDFDNNTEVVNLILEKMQKFGINYKVSKQNKLNNTNTGIDIENVDKAIKNLEIKVFGEDENVEQAEVEYLMDLYKKVRIFNNIRQ